MVSYPYLLETVNRATVYPDWYPCPLWLLTLEDKESLEFEAYNIKEQAARHFAKLYDLGSWVSISKGTNLTLEDWIGRDSYTHRYGMHDTVKWALAYEYEKYVDELNRREEDVRKQMSAAQNDISSGLSRSFVQNSAMGSYK